MQASWYPSIETINRSNIQQMMLKNDMLDYREFWRWSVRRKKSFWTQTLHALSIQFHEPYKKILDVSEGSSNAKWLEGAKMNIVDSCFQNPPDATAVVYQEPGGPLVKVSQAELEQQVNRMANALVEKGILPGERIAIDMPMTLEAVSIYLGAIKAGVSVVTIADSFTANEIAVRLGITGPKLVFTQENMERAGKTLPLYDKIIKAEPAACVVVATEKKAKLRDQDQYFEDFLSDKDSFKSYPADPDREITVLFSSGTTGAPKAIPWTHVTPIKGASDGFYHQDIHPGEVVCWPTNLGWMMGPWLIFASLINKASMALYYGVPSGEDFGRFVQDAKVNMLGVVPSLVRQWKISKCMEGLNWERINCFSSTGEASNPDEMEYLMALGGNKPVIEYCGGTEVGGGYVTSTVVQPNIASTFSTQALGGEFLIYDEQGRLGDEGEIFIVPPIPGLSSSLLNRDHQEVYYQGTPVYKGVQLRRHGDSLQRLENGYFKAQGRADDAMNLGGIKVSSVQIEEVINQLDAVKESAAIAVSPKGGGPSKLVIYYVASGDLEKDAADSSVGAVLPSCQRVVREQLNPLFKVAEVIEKEALPRTASGKVMRRKLRSDYYLERD